MYKNILKALVEVLIFFGALITLFCLIVFSFIASKVWMTIMAGVGAMYTLFIFDRYRQMKNDKNP